VTTLLNVAAALVLCLPLLVLAVHERRTRKRRRVIAELLGPANLPGRNP
jgi:hypothetical protein